MADRLEVDVYPTDAEAFEATAALAAERLRAAPGGRPTVALTGGRIGRGVLVALAARTDLPWDAIDWWWAEERCVAADDAASNVRVARDSLLGPRAVPPERIHAPPVELQDAARIAAAYAESLGREPIFDLVLLALGPSGGVAGLMPGARALGQDAAVVAVAAEEAVEEPRVARITVGPRVLQAAPAIIVTAVGAEIAEGVAAAMGDPVEPSRCPAQLVRPSARVSWVLDRAAAGRLLQVARVVER